MAAEIIFTIDTSQPAEGRNQHSLQGVEDAYAAEFGSKVVASGGNDHILIINQIGDIEGVRRWLI